MLNELQTWWEGATPETRAALLDGGLAVAALVGGFFLAAVAARVLRSWDFDGAFRLPSASPPGLQADRGVTPTRVAALLVRLTVWAAAAGWLARRHGRADVAETIGLVIPRVWALAAVLAAALGLGGLVARRVADFLQVPVPGGPGAAASRNGAVPHRGVAGAVGAGVYGLVVLLTLLTAADFFDWPLTRSAAAALWQLALQLLTAGAALLVACLGARWARDLAPPAVAGSSEQRAGQYTALALIGGTTVLAVATMLSGTGVLIALAAVAVVGALLWAARGYLPDVTAGLQLRARKVGQVWFDGDPWQVAGVGLLTTEVGRAGAFSRVQNRLVLEAAAHAVPVGAGRR
jgi:hypothetical protein